MEVTFKKLFIAFAFLLIFQNIAYAQFIVNDTTFLLREHQDDDYHAVFIDYNKNSKYYKRIADFDVASEMDAYKSYLKQLKEKNPKPLVKHKIADIHRQWCMLYLFKGKYYLYSPSDYIYNYRAIISDSTFIDYHGADGPEPSRIISYSRPDSKTCKFILESYSGRKEVYIHIIDRKRGIAIFENAGYNTYMLMVQSDKLKAFPIIVNYSINNKQLEYDLDKPDYNKLINGK